MNKHHGRWTHTHTYKVFGFGEEEDKQSWGRRVTVAYVTCRWAGWKGREEITLLTASKRELFQDRDLRLMII